MKKLLILFVLSVFLLPCHNVPAQGEKELIDDGTSNLLGGKSNVYQKLPSNAKYRRGERERNGKEEKVLMIKYEKLMSGGPFGQGGWCGYYTLLATDSETYDATQFSKLTFWVKAKTGAENFMVGLADAEWAKKGDSVKSEAIGKYLPSGKLTTDWQKAEIPLSVYSLDYQNLFSIAFCFESSLFDETGSTGVIYIDDITLE